MGRLTLHMLLSFAQFEREVTAERIRDKVAASKRKGLWMGGRVPLGYEKDERTLRINEAEAKTVQTLYALYRKHGTLRQVKAEADRLRLRTKQRFAADGTRTGGLPFRRGHLHCLLTNPLYAGRIRHQRRVYEGQHPSIIASELWDAVQTQLQAGAAKPRRRTTKGRAVRSPLAGKLFDETGDRLTPSHTKKKNGQRLRYYVSRRLIPHSGQKDLSGWRLPAPMLEQTVVHLIRQHVDATTSPASLIHAPTMQELASVRRFLDGLCSGSKNDSASAAPLLRLIRRVDISPGSVSILLDRNTFAATPPVFIVVCNNTNVPQIQLLKEHEDNFHYISALTKPQIEGLLKKGILQMSLFDEAIAEVLSEEGGERFVVRRNPIRAEEMKRNRQDRLDSLNNRVEKYNAYLEEHPKAKVEVGLRRMKDNATRLKIHKWVEIEPRGTKLSLQVNPEELAAVEKLDGCYALRTDLSPTAASKQTIHDRYKDLALVEWAFRTSKNWTP